MGKLRPEIEIDDQSAEIHAEYAANGSLEKILKSVHRGRPPKFWNATGIGIIICGIVMGMKFVHSRGFTHRDLKPANILVNDQGQALVADFGTTRADEDDHTLTHEAGTVHYAAPETFREDPYINRVDVFSFGSVLYELITESPVFKKSMQPFPIMRLLLKGEMPPIPDKYGELMQKLIPRCWSMIPENRPSFEQIMKEFQAVRFSLVPNADAHRIREYFCGVTAWEVRSAISSS